MLSSGSGDQLRRPLVVLLWRWLFTVLVYWGLFSLPHPLSLGQGQWSISCPPAVSVIGWFTVCFSILQSKLRRWVLWSTTCPALGSGLSPTHCQPSCLSCICLVIICGEISALLLPLYSVHFQQSRPFRHVLELYFITVWCLLFSFFSFLGGVSLPRGLCWFIPGVAGGIPCDAWCSPVWSAKCLTGRFGVGGCGRPPIFSVWCSMGFRVSKFWFSLMLYFHKVWLEHLISFFPAIIQFISYSTL
jgi:hypothetical protein